MIKKILKFLFFTNIVIIWIILFLLYGPFTFFRNFWITSAMTSNKHNYLAYTFYNEKTISIVMKNNYVSNFSFDTNPDLIDFNANNNRFYKNRYDRQIINHKSGDLYKVINIDEDMFNGYLVAIYDASKVSLAISKNLGSSGELITDVSKRENAIVSINSVAYYDPNWNGNGAIPHGRIIKNGKVINSFKKSVDSGFIGFDYDSRLVLSRDDRNIYKYRDAVEFGPFLIVNGICANISGNGGWGIAPRTAIAQRKDGIVLFLVINGRVPSSIGASMNDVVKILHRYGAYNAANMDGGSSTELLIENKIINKPVGGGKNGLRLMPTYWVVKD